MNNKWVRVYQRENQKFLKKWEWGYKLSVFVGYKKAMLWGNVIAQQYQEASGR